MEKIEENNENYGSFLPCFGKAVVDAKNIYTNFLINILVPLIHEGIADMYVKACKYDEEYKKRAKVDSKFENPGLVKIFQHFFI